MAAFVTTYTLPRTGLGYGVDVVNRRSCSSQRKQDVIFAPFTIEASKHAQLKAAKKSNRRRPKKHRPSDINRKPPPYDVAPLHNKELGPDWSVLKEGEIIFEGEQVEVVEPEEGTVRARFLGELI